MRLLPILMVLLIAAIAHAQSASSRESSTQQPAPFHLKIGAGEVPVYSCRIVSLTPEQREKVKDITIDGTSEAAFANFDVAGPTEVSVTCARPPHSAVVLPASANIMATISQGTVTLTVPHPGQFTLEIDGDWIHSLHLFANPPETDVPHPDDPNVIYFGSGDHEIDPLKVESGKTLYLAPGAVVYGKPGTHNAIIALVGSNITLRGRGIIDGSRRVRGAGGILYVQGSNIHVEGVTLRDSDGWTFPTRRSDHVRIDNVKLFGWRGNADGMDICNSRDVVVNNCFLRTFDDLVVIKSDQGQGPVKDVLVENCTLWNEFAHALSLGAELRDPVENVTFADCEVIHDKGREWDLRIYNCDAAAVKHVTFKNIRIDECRRLISLWIGRAMWSKQNERGHIDDVTFQNIASTAPERASTPVELVGFDADHAINGVLLDHVSIAGQPLRLSDVKQNAFVHDVTIEPK